MHVLCLCVCVCVCLSVCVCDIVYITTCLMGDIRSVVRALEFESEDPGFDPLAGHGERQFFYPSESTLVQTCLCLTLLRVYGMHVA